MYIFANSLLPVEEHMEPASKRRKIELHIPDVDHSLPPPTKKDLLDSLRFIEIDDRFVNIKPGHAKTCRWLLESTGYLDWLSADKLPEHRGFFWIKGKPGCGKSTLTKFAFMEIKRSLPNVILLSFFFNARGTDLEKSTIGLYRSLLVQLLETCPDDQQLWNIPSITRRPLDDQFKANREILKHLLARVLQTLGQCNIMVIIDALDECDEDEVRDMIALFEKLGEDAVSDGRTFRVLFSSRHYPHITIQRSVQMKLEDQQGHSHDIEKYLSSELNAGRGKKVEVIRQEIRDRASGVFIWVVLVVKILNKALDHGHVHDLPNKLRELPSDLSELFRSILTRDRQNMAEMKLCLQWILYANRPLKREELYFAILSGLESEEPLLPWDPGEISTENMNCFILSSSKGLAEITKSKHNTVQFIHESVRDFLLKENGLSLVWADLKVNVTGLSHDRLKKCCFNYTRSNIASHLDVSETLPLTSSPEAAVLRKNVSLKFPFLEYAAGNILAHADISHAKGIDQERFIKEFELSNWVQLNNILEKHQVRRLPPDIDLLYILAERNFPNLIDVLMRDGRCIRNQNWRYGNPIFAAIVNDSYQVLEALVQRDSQRHPYGCEFPYPTEGIFSFLVKHGTPALIHRFLSVYSIDATSTLRGGGTMLLWASAGGHEKVAELLLDQGADAKAQGGEYGNALQAASYRGHEKVAELLLNRGADAKAQGGMYGNALQAASYGGHEKVAELLLNRGADAKAQGGMYSNALQAALYRGHEKVAELLLNRGADANAQGGYYTLPPPG